MVSLVWTAIHESDSAQTCLRYGQMASRSGGSNEKETAILSVACSGLRGERPGCLVATTSRHEGGEGILPQTPEKIRLHSTGHRHRLAKKLRSGKKANTEECIAVQTYDTIPKSFHTSPRFRDRASFFRCPVSSRERCSRATQWLIISPGKR